MIDSNQVIAFIVTELEATKARPEYNEPSRTTYRTGWLQGYAFGLNSVLIKIRKMQETQRFQSWGEQQVLRAPVQTNPAVTLSEMRALLWRWSRLRARELIQIHFGNPSLQETRETTTAALEFLAHLSELADDNPVMDVTVRELLSRERPPSPCPDESPTPSSKPDTGSSSRSPSNEVPLPPTTAPSLPEATTT